MNRIFLLSPAQAGGKRARLLLGPKARCDMALKLRSQPGVSLGEVFSFLSGLYFRGKLAYATWFAHPPAGVGGIHVITSNRGLWAAESLVTLKELRLFSRVPIDPADDRYRRPLKRDAQRLAERVGRSCEVILLGSVATPKYVELLLEVFGPQLKFPVAFVGRGDMSRGGLMLRAVAAGEELEYALVDGAARRGPKPPKLPRLKQRVAAEVNGHCTQSAA